MKTVSFEKQTHVMSMDKIIFLSKAEAICVDYPSSIFQIIILSNIFENWEICLIYLTVILRGRAGYELIYITNEAVGRVGYYQLISGKSEKNNCFSKFSSSPITGNCH